MKKIKRHNILRILAVLSALFLGTTAFAVPSYVDVEDGTIHRLFRHGRGKYILRNKHTFRDTLYIPKGCILTFKGGSLSGPLVFNETKLKGCVNLKGSHIKGSVQNRTFNASWLCAMDGVTDDAQSINEILSVCTNVFFPKGIYRLKSSFKKENFHIGIGLDNISMKGEKGTVFFTKERHGIICVFSKPYDIPNSVKNIKIKGITFRTQNDGSIFLQWTHAIQTKGVNGFIIEKCTIEDFWGDGICLNHYNDNPQTGERARNQNVKILKNTIIGGNLHNNRNGISVINGKDVLIKKNTIRNTSRKDMPGAIDVEPNNSAYTIENIKIIANTIEDSWGSCGAIEVCMFNGGPGHHIFVEKNRISKSNLGIYVYLKTEDSTEHFVIRKNRVAADTPPYKFVGNGKSKDWVVSGNRFEQPTKERMLGDMQIENLRMK